MKKWLLIILFLITNSATADIEVDKNNVAKCNQKDADAGMTYAITACAGNESEKYDSEMNRIYKQLIFDIKKKNEPATAKKYMEHLKATQRAWIKFRDTQCHLEDGGSMESLKVNTCRQKMTAHRTQELKDAACTEGDLSTPCYLYN